MIEQAFEQGKLRRTVVGLDARLLEVAMFSVEDGEDDRLPHLFRALRKRPVGFQASNSGILHEAA